MVRVAVVGLGFMGKTHLGVYRKLPDVAVTALCDPRTEMLELKSLQPGGNIRTTEADSRPKNVRAFLRFDEMLAAGGFEVVDICAPTPLHAEYSIRALDAGYHVFCEKPMALSTEEARRILDTVERSGKLFSVGQCLRYWPAYAEVKKLLDSGRYGATRYAEFDRCSAPPRWSSDGWMNDPSRSGSPALDLHVHDVDMVLYLFGPPRAIQSDGVFDADGGLRHITTIYRYRDLLVKASGGWLATSTFGFNMRALYLLERATIELDFSKDPAVMVYPEGEPKYALPLPDGDGYYYELKDFCEGVARGTLSGVVTGRSAADAVRMCLLEIESARNGAQLPWEP
jgi:predicted dehydrogenase